MPKSVEQKRLEAEERRNDYELRSIDEQLAELKKRPGSSAKERDKLIQMKREIKGVKVP